MIPKKIHYCWFGRNELPETAKKCIDSWKKYFPEYEIIQWNEDNYDAKEYLFGLKSKGVVGDSEFEQILAVISTYFKKIDRIELEKILKKEKLTADSILN
jgi:hypothetical protein